MLIEHFKLGVQPFGVTPDSKFLYLSKTHREALASLFYGIHSGRGFTALIAQPGMGKTTLLVHLLGLLMANAKTAFLFQTLCGPEEFLRSLLADLGIDSDGDMARMHAKLNAYLLQESRNGSPVVVVIDEAQNLDDRVLELVRMLSNFETPGKKLMHLVLSGQPQLADRLSSEHLAQLRQRVSIVARLAPLNADEIREYINHRLCVAGANSRDAVFSEEALALIADHSHGIPRNINNLCFNSMSLACALKQRQVDASMVQETINDLDLKSLVGRELMPPAPPRPDSPHDSTVAVHSAGRVRRWAIAGGSLIFLALLTSYLWAGFPGRLFSSPNPKVHQPSLSSATNEVAGETVQRPNAGAVALSGDSDKTLPTLAPASIPSAYEAQGGRNQKTRVKGKQPKARVDRTSVRPLELSPLPTDLERLRASRAAEFSIGQPISERAQTRANKSSVPFDPGPQRETQ